MVVTGKNKRRPWKKQKKCRACTLFARVEGACALFPTWASWRDQGGHKVSLYLLTRTTRPPPPPSPPYAPGNAYTSVITVGLPLSGEPETKDAAVRSYNAEAVRRRKPSRWHSIRLGRRQLSPRCATVKRLRLPFTEVRKRASLHLGVTSVT